MKNIFLAFTVIACLNAFSQARIDINNNSIRQMTVKVMHYGGAQNTLFETVRIPAYEEKTVYFSESGTYFTKTKAFIANKNPVFRKGKRFEVVNDPTGYSVLTLTFTIKESATPEVSGGTQISQEEFEKN